MIYMEKFTRFFQDQETIEDWCATWAEGLGGLTHVEIKYGLEILARNHPWPPTMSEFRACCKAAPSQYKPLLEAPRHGVTEHAKACMAKINETLANPKKPGAWWADEVLELERKGKRTTTAAHDLAIEVQRKNGWRREPVALPPDQDDGIPF